jgi:hypothetical protein
VVLLEPTVLVLLMAVESPPEVVKGGRGVPWVHKVGSGKNSRDETGYVGVQSYSA